MKQNDLTGRKFGMWFVESLSHKKGLDFYWNCVCDCGTKKTISGPPLKKGNSTNCGCKRRTANGMSKHPAYNSWKSMRIRCLNPKAEGYELYGGAGVMICDRWKDDFNAFWEDMGPTWQAGLSLDRHPIKNGNYYPDNCRWATDQQQADNRSTECIINTPDGPMSVTHAAERFGICRNTIFGRIGYGWPEEDLLLPVRDMNHDSKGMFTHATGRKV